VFKELRGEKFHSFPAVNTLFGAMAHHAEFSTVDWSSLVLSVGGGMAVQSATAKLWLEKTGCPIVEGYGLSELRRGHLHPVDSIAYSGNIGLPLPNTELSCSTTTATKCRWHAGRDQHPRPAGDGRYGSAPTRLRR